MQVRALRDCFIEGGHYRKAGEVFDYKGPKNENLESVKKMQADKLEAQAEEEEKASETK